MPALLKSKKEQNLFDLLERQAEVAVRASEEFLAMCTDFGNMAAYTDRLDKLEHEGDVATHELQNSIAATFITPLDKEDLRELSQALDDITDLVEAAAARAELYGLKETRPDLKTLTELLVKLSHLTRDAVREMRFGFRRTQGLNETLKQIHTVENESDRAFRLALKTLFDEPGIDPLTVIKWKELYDRIETASDKCEQVAAIIGTIVVKYA